LKIPAKQPQYQPLRTEQHNKEAFYHENYPKNGKNTSTHTILSEKTIYIAKNNPHWQTHPILNEIRNHQHVQIPHPPSTTSSLNEWINVIAAIAKTANKEARKITTKYTKDCILKAVSKYRQMYEKNPKKNR
jgi:hypothetical protein